MAITAQQMTVFNNLEQDELDMVSNFASSLIRNRTSHTDAYYKFQEARKRMLKKNPMSEEEIDKEIHKVTAK
ncbi:MAG: hypothetical protein J5476_00705 [Lachnospiraceae bacterium]|nr:hypothetical protein [Lachnospiraceae bacterium]